MVPQIHIVRTADGADFPLPSYTSKHHMGLNLMAAVASPLKINPRERVHVPVGFAVAIPDGLCGMIVSNREMALDHGVIVLDAPCVLHPADRRPLFVLLRNESNKQFILRRGMMIAQLLIMPAFQVAWQEVQTDEKPQHTSTHAEIFVDEEPLETSTEEIIDRPLQGASKRPKVSIRERSAGHGE